MEQELPTAFWPLHSPSEGGWLIQGHLLFLPAPRHHMWLLQLLLLIPKMDRLEHWVRLFLPRLHRLSAPHLLCTGRRGAEGEKTSTSNIYTYFESTGGGSRPLLPALTHSTHKMTLFTARRRLLTGRIYIVLGHQIQDQAGSPVSRAATHRRNWSGRHKPAPFSPCTEEMGQRRTPAVPPSHLCGSHPSTKTFPTEKPTAFSNPKMPAHLHIKVRQKSHSFTK